MKGGGEDDGVEGFFVCGEVSGEGVRSSGFDGVLVFGLGDGGDGCVEVGAGVGGIEHAGEDLPVSAFDLHCSFYGHTHHSFKAMDEIEVLAIVDSGASLNDVGGERGTDLGTVNVCLTLGATNSPCWLRGTALQSLKL